MIPVTQSLIKDLYQYRVNQSVCGLQLEAKYEKGMEFPPSDAQLLGQWFEYQVTGQTTKHGKVPIAPVLKGGQLPEKYQKMKAHIEVAKIMFEAYGLKIIETGKRIKTNGNLQGDIDVVCENTEGRKVFVDIKTSALLDDNWSPFGWGDDGIEQKDGLMLQPIHYKVLGKYEYGYFPDFYFFIFSTSDPHHRKVFKIQHQDERIQQHAQAITKAVETLQEIKEVGWKPIPTPKACGHCPLYETCEHAAIIPTPKVVYY